MMEVYKGPSMLAKNNEEEGGLIGQSELCNEEDSTNTQEIVATNT